MTQGYNALNLDQQLKPGQERQYTPEELLELAKCFRDPVYFCNTYCFIVTLDEGLTKKPLYPYQETLIKSAISNNFTICKLPRQSGKTQSVALLITWLILFNDNYTIGVVAQNEKTAKEILKRVKTAYDHLPDFLKKAPTSWNETSIRLENGSTVRVSGTSSASARGGSFNFLYLDEFAFVPEYIQKEFYESTMPTIAAGKSGRVLITSTPRGLNLFYKIWKESELGLNDFERIAIEWFDVPGRDEEWRLKQIRLMGQESFDQEYQTDFIGSSNTLISPQKLRMLVHSIPISQSNGLDLYSLPATDRLYILIADVARGVSLDYSAFCVIDVTSWPYKIVAKYQSNKINSIQYAQFIVNIATNYNNAYCLVEINDIGQEIVDIMFNDFSYTNLFAHHTKNKNKQVDAGFAEDGQSKLGVRTTRLVKRLGCNRLKNLIESDKLIIEDYHIIEQLSKFVQKYKSYEADDGHDDLVMCLVLFAWLVDTPLFQRMTETSFRRDLLREKELDSRNQINVFGFRHTGIEEYIPFKAPIEQKTVPFYDWTNSEWGTKMVNPDPVMDDLEAQFFFGETKGVDTKEAVIYPIESTGYRRQRK